MAVTMALKSARLEIDGLSFDVPRMGSMGTRPAPDAAWPPTTFVYTGEQEVECSVSREQHDAAFELFMRTKSAPCVLWLQPHVAPMHCTFTVHHFFTDIDGCTMKGFVYQDAYGGKPVTDPSLVAYLIEQHTPKPLTPEEEAALDADSAWYDGE